MLEPDIDQRERQQHELPSKGGVREIFVGLDGEQPRSSQQSEAQTRGGAAHEKGPQYLDGKAPEQSEQSQVQRHNGAEQQPETQDVRGIDE